MKIKTLIFILLLSLIQSDENVPENGVCEEPSEVFDVADDEGGNDAIHEAARHNIFAMALKKSKTGPMFR